MPAMTPAYVPLPPQSNTRTATSVAPLATPNVEPPTVPVAHAHTHPRLYNVRALLEIVTPQEGYRPLTSDRASYKFTPQAATRGSSRDGLCVAMDSRPCACTNACARVRVRVSPWLPATWVPWPLQSMAVPPAVTASKPRTARPPNCSCVSRMPVSATYTRVPAPVPFTLNALFLRRQSTQHTRLRAAAHSARRSATRTYLHSNNAHA